MTNELQIDKLNQDETKTVLQTKTRRPGKYDAVFAAVAALAPGESVRVTSKTIPAATIQSSLWSRFRRDKSSDFSMRIMGKTLLVFRVAGEGAGVAGEVEID